MSEEDLKLITLARGARGRVGAAAGAAIRDETGRSYASANVALDNLRLSALQLVVATAVAAGAKGCELAVVLAEDGLPDPAGLAALRDFAGHDVTVLGCTPSGSVVTRQVSGDTA